MLISPPALPPAQISAHPACQAGDDSVDVKITVKSLTGQNATSDFTVTLIGFNEGAGEDNLQQSGKDIYLGGYTGFPCFLFTIAQMSVVKPKLVLAKDFLDRDREFGQPSMDTSTSFSVHYLNTKNDDQHKYEVRLVDEHGTVYIVDPIIHNDGTPPNQPMHGSKHHHHHHHHHHRHSRGHHGRERDGAAR